MKTKLLLMVGTARCAVCLWKLRLIPIRGHRSAASLPKPTRREIFVLTPEEKKTVCFVLIAFVLGLVTKFYRDRHPSPTPKPTTARHSHAMPKAPPAPPRRR